MSARHVFVVMGSSGDFEREEWLVRAFAERPAAEEWAALAKKGAERIAERVTQHWERHPDYATTLPKMRNRWDPRADEHSGSAEYVVVTVPFTTPHPER